MGDASYAITSFLGGEISQFAQGRFEKPDYRISLNVCFNAFPVEIGPWVRRPGSQFAGTTLGGLPGRAIKWDFEQASPYTIELTNGNARFRQGASLVSNNDSQAVSNISTADPAVVTVTTAPATGSTVMFGGGPALLQNRQLTWTNISGTTGSIADAITGAAIDGSTLGSLPSGTTMYSIQTLSTPYIGGTWANVRMVQAETTGILLLGGVAPQALTVTALPTLATAATFAIDPATFNDGPYLDPFTNGVMATPNQATGIVKLTLSFPAYVSTTSYAVGDFVTASSINYISIKDQNVGNTPSSSPTYWTAVSAGAAINPPPTQPTGIGRGFLSTDIGRLVRLFSEPALWLVGSTYSEGEVISYNPTGVPGAATYWQSLTNSNAGNQPGSDLINWELVAPGAALPSIGTFTNPAASSGPAQWTWGKIISLLNFIPGSPSGIVQIGNMIGNGGLAAAFNGNTTQNSASSAEIYDQFTPTGTAIGYVGQNYSGCSPADYATASATIFPTSDQGLIYASGIAGTILTATAYLYGSNSLPSSYSNGTLLGSAAIGQFTLSSSDVGLAFATNAINISSSNTATTFAYLWVAVTVKTSLPSNTDIVINIAQVEFVAAAGSGSSANGCSVELLGPPLLYTTAISTWQLGAFSDTTGWPTTGCYADGRLWLGGAIANRFDACVSNGIVGSEVNFAPTDQYGTVSDDNAFNFTLNDDSVNPIFWMQPDQQGILVGTQAREFLLYGPSGGGMTPTNIAARPVTRIGCAFVPPMRTEHTNVFVQRYGVKLVEYFPDVFSGKYTAPNLADKAQHITRAGIQELAYTQATTPIVWGRCGDGSLFGLTYKRDTLMTSSGPTFYAWHRHGLGSGRQVVSVASGPSIGGNLDALTMVTNQANSTDPQGGVYHVEILTDTMDELTPAADAWFLDDAVVPSSTVGSNAAVTYSAWASGTTYAQGNTVTYNGGTYTSLTNSNTGNVPSTSTVNWLAAGAAPYGGLTLNGLWHLNGEVVAVSAGGLDCGSYIVVSGSVFVPYGDGISAGTGAGLFTATFAASGVQIVVGFTYTSQGQLVRPLSPQDTGARNGPALGKKRRTQQIAALLNNVGVSTAGGGAGAISFGANFTRMLPAIFKQPNGINYTPLQTWSGVWWDSIATESGFDSMIAWQITRPYPANVIAIESFLHTEDK